MELKEIQSCIENFQKTINDSSEKQFLQLFEKADFFELEDKSFKDFSKEYFNVFFGIKDDKLIGFVVNVSDDYEKWNEETEVYAAGFKDFSDQYFKEFTKNYESIDGSKEKTAIEFKEAIVRISEWKKNKLEWFSKTKETGEMISYFQVPSADFANGSSNSFFLGLENSNGNIDVIVGNPTGLYNVSRPVPPFEPIRF